MPSDPIGLRHFEELVGQYTKEYIKKKATRFFFPLDLSKRLRLDLRKENSLKSKHIYVHSGFPLSRPDRLFRSDLLGFEGFYVDAAWDRERKERDAYDAIVIALEEDLGSKEVVKETLEKAKVDHETEPPSITVFDLFRIHCLAKGYVERHNAALAKKSESASDSSLLPRTDGNRRDPKQDHALEAYYGKGRTVYKGPAQSSQENAEKTHHATGKFSSAASEGCQAVESHFGHNSPFSNTYSVASLQNQAPYLGDAAQQKASNVEGTSEGQQPADPAEGAKWLIKRLINRIFSDIGAQEPEELKARRNLMQRLGVLLLNEDVTCDENIAQLTSKFLYTQWYDIKKFAEKNPLTEEQISLYNDLVEMMRAAGRWHAFGGKIPTKEDKIKEAEEIQTVKGILDELDLVIEKDIRRESSKESELTWEKNIRELEATLRRGVVLGVEDAVAWLKGYRQKKVELRDIVPKGKQEDYGAVLSHLDNIIVVLTKSLYLWPPESKQARRKVPKEGPRETKNRKPAPVRAAKVDPSILRAQEEREEEVRTTLAYLRYFRNYIKKSIIAKQLEGLNEDSIGALKESLGNDGIVNDGRVQQSLHDLLDVAYSDIFESAYEQGVGLGQRQLYFELVDRLDAWLPGASGPVSRHLQELKQTLEQELNNMQIMRYHRFDQPALERMLKNRLACAIDDLQKLGRKIYEPADITLLDGYLKAAGEQGLDQKAAKEIAASARSLMERADGGIEESEHSQASDEAYESFSRSCWDIVLVADAFAENWSDSGQIADEKHRGAKALDVGTMSEGTAEANEKD